MTINSADSSDWPDDSAEQGSSDRKSLQFGLGWLFVLTALVAVALVPYGLFLLVLVIIGIGFHQPGRKKRY